VFHCDPRSHTFSPLRSNLLGPSRGTPCSCDTKSIDRAPLVPEHASNSSAMPHADKPVSPARPDVPVMSPVCRGDDLWGMPRAELLAGWRPRSLHGARMRRLAPPEWAGCASSWLMTPLRRARAGRRRQDSSNGGIAKSDRSPTRSIEAKDEVTPATTGLNQSATKDPSPRKDPRQTRAYAPQMPDQREKGAL
jgi:hypothetical protein